MLLPGSVILCLLSTGRGFSLHPRVQSPRRSLDLADATTSYEPRSKPRTGPGQFLLNVMLESPFWKIVLVPQARKKMIDTAAENGIPWEACKRWLISQDGPWNQNVVYPTTGIPDYYYKEYHAYENGNLCWESALEVEIAATSVGARNFPKFGRNGETAFRDSFGVALEEAGAVCKDGGHIVDFGCGTGMSSRWLANNYPQAASILGIDLSEYFVQVGSRLLELEPTEERWVSTIKNDSRIRYRQGDATATGLPNDSVDVVVLQFVAHELPCEVTVQMIMEASRILKDGGQFWFCEMDFEAPAYAAQRANPLLFSLIRSTEPYLDEYADHALEIREALTSSFADVKMAAATGRHFSVVATKGGKSGFADLRFDSDGNYRVEDTHLKVFENKL